MHNFGQLLTLFQRLSLRSLGEVSVKIPEDHGVQRNTRFGRCLNSNTNRATAHTCPLLFANSGDGGLGSAGPAGEYLALCAFTVRAPRAGGAHVQKGGQGPQCNPRVSMAPDLPPGDRVSSHSGARRLTADLRCQGSRPPAHGRCFTGGVSVAVWGGQVRATLLATASGLCPRIAWAPGV